MKDDSIHRRIELVWPGKELARRPRQQTNGEWSFESDDGTRTLRSLKGLVFYPARDTHSASLVVAGDRIECLATLARGYAHQVKLAYFDTPRLRVDDKAAGFRSDNNRVVSTWLDVLRGHLEAALPLLRRDSAVVVHVGDLEEPYARLLCGELMGVENQIGTIAWQRSYAPRNMRNMREFTFTHDLLLVYALDRSFLPPVGMPEPPAGFANPDGDPRGDWKAEHKGAKSRREKSDFSTYQPPYRWTLVGGNLPKGLWRVSEQTGVVWGTPEETGRFALTVEVEDSSGQTAKRKVHLLIKESEAPPEFPDIPWLFEEIKPSGKLRIVTRTLSTGVLSQEYSSVLLADGGSPYLGRPIRPRSGRYWEFADYTLVAAYQHDAVHLGKKATSIPHPKKYLRDHGDVVLKNQQTWWPGRRATASKKTEIFAGYTEDATKHLKKLHACGAIERVDVAAKPEALLDRLIRIFTEPRDLVLEVFGQAGDLAAVALKRERRFLMLSGGSKRARSLMDGCAIPRLRAVVDGLDCNLDQKAENIRMRADAYIPFYGGGSFVTADLGPVVYERRLGDDLPTLSFFSNDTDGQPLEEAVLTAHGFLPLDGDFSGRSLDGSTGAIFVDPEEYLTPEKAAEFASRLLESYERGLILYFRASEDFDASRLSTQVVSVRVPFEVEF